MNVRLIAAVITTMGLGACGPDVTPQSSDAPSGPTAASAPAQPAAEPKAAESDKPATPLVAQEGTKVEGAAPGSEAERDEGDKKAD